MPNVTFPYEIIVQGVGLKKFSNDTYYGGRGGEGTILKDPPTAYKIYHDEKRMIPVNKIEELQPLRRFPNILGPQDIIFDAKKTKTPIGFTMAYVDQREFLTSLFNRNFKEDNSITPDKIIELVKKLQETLQNIHAEKILVVDFNEMNFLLDSKTFSQIYFIDVDSYQTKSHHATAIMESIRDRKIKNNQWTAFSDWFSFAVVSFQMYTGVHPYRGKHPDFKVNEWPLRMEKGVSVFDKDVTLPPSFMGWDVIPKPHLDWFKDIFKSNNRSIPPMPDGSISCGPSLATLISSSGKFQVKVIQGYDENIRSVHFSNGCMYTVTKKSIYKGRQPWYTLTKKYTQLGLMDVAGNDPLIVYKEGGTLQFMDNSDVVQHSLYADTATELNGIFYSLQGGYLRQHTAQKFQKIIVSTKTVTQVTSNTVLHKGVAVQDILGRIWLAIPYELNKCSNIPIPELDGYRILNAKYESKFCVLIAEKAGKYDRVVLFYNDTHDKYVCRITQDVDFNDISFTVKGNGVCIIVTAPELIEVTRDNNKVYEYSDSPIDPDIRLFSDGLSALFFNGGKIYSVSMS